MSQFILDDQLDETVVLPSIRKWFKFQRLRDLRPHERILDDRVPEILQTLKQVTFLTIDRDFWDRDYCHPGYGILYFAIPDNQQEHIPESLRLLLRHPEFRTRAARMGKVARIRPTAVDWWQFQVVELRSIPWLPGRRRGTGG